MDTALVTSTDSANASLKIATVAYLARFKGQTRTHADSDLRAFLAWCQRQKLDPLEARRPHIELYLRWMQEVAHYKPSTVSRRLSILTGFYRICVIDAVLPASPAEYVRRPRAPSESPTLGLNHLQFEAMLSAGRTSANVNDFALVSMLGLSACGSSRRPQPTSKHSKKFMATASCAYMARATRSRSSRYRRLLGVR